MRVKEANEGWVFLSILFLLIFIGLLPPNTGFAATPKIRVTTVSQKAKLLSPRESAIVNSLLRQAQQAHARGDTQQTKSLLFQAHQINPELPTPTWTKKALAPGRQQKPREHLMEEVRSNPGNADLLRFEEYVRKNPKDLEAREMLIQAAISAGAVKVLQRIESSNEENTQWFSVLKWLLTILLATALIWPIYALIRDLRAS